MYVDAQATCSSMPDLLHLGRRNMTVLTILNPEAESHTSRHLCMEEGYVSFYEPWSSTSQSRRTAQQRARTLRSFEELQTSSLHLRLYSHLHLDIKQRHHLNLTTTSPKLSSKCLDLAAALVQPQGQQQRLQNQHRNSNKPVQHPLQLTHPDSSSSHLSKAPNRAKGPASSARWLAQLRKPPMPSYPL